jgi:hypothetical protein
MTLSKEDVSRKKEELQDRLSTKFLNVASISVGVSTEAGFDFAVRIWLSNQAVDNQDILKRVKDEIKAWDDQATPNVRLMISKPGLE